MEEMTTAPTPAPVTHNPTQADAQQWLKNALYDAKRSTHDHGHVAWLIEQNSAGKIVVSL